MRIGLLAILVWSGIHISGCASDSELNDVFTPTHGVSDPAPGSNLPLLPELETADLVVTQIEVVQVDRKYEVHATIKNKGHKKTKAFMVWCKVDLNLGQYNDGLPMELSIGGLAPGDASTKVFPAHAVEHHPNRMKVTVIADLPKDNLRGDVPEHDEANRLIRVIELR